jgi:hypothetical protein
VRRQQTPQPAQPAQPEPAHGPTIGAFRNHWRQRYVAIYEHPNDPARVITCGLPYGDGAAIWTDEPRDSYREYIGSFGKVYE